MVAQWAAVNHDGFVGVGEFDGVGNQLVQQLCDIFRYAIDKYRLIGNIRLEFRFGIGKLVAFNTTVQHLAEINLLTL